MGVPVQPVKRIEIQTEIKYDTHDKEQIVNTLYKLNLQKVGLQTGYKLATNLAENGFFSPAQA